MKKTLYTFLIVTGTLALVNCKDEANKVNATDMNDSITITDTINEAKNAKNSIDYFGTYEGVLPCFKSDCKEIELSIQLIENDVFIYSTKRLGIDQEPLMTTGNYHFEDNGNIIVLDQIANVPNAYYISEGKLYQLDKDKKKIEGENAKKYILLKK